MHIGCGECGRGKSDVFFAQEAPRAAMDMKMDGSVGLACGKPVKAFIGAFAILLVGVMGLAFENRLAGGPVSLHDAGGVAGPDALIECAIQGFLIVIEEHTLSHFLVS